jgi:hypothetical protein
MSKKWFAETTDGYEATLKGLAEMEKIVDASDKPEEVKRKWKAMINESRKSITGKLSDNISNLLEGTLSDEDFANYWESSKQNGLELKEGRYVKTSRGWSTTLKEANSLNKQI